MQPQSGGRVVLKLERTTPGRAEYSAKLFTPEGAWLGTLSVSADQLSDVVWEPESPSPPEWLLELMRALLSQARRQYAASASKPEQARWPRRVSRWRPEPRALTSAVAPRSATTSPEASRSTATQVPKDAPKDANLELAPTSAPRASDAPTASNEPAVPKA